MNMNEKSKFHIHGHPNFATPAGFHKCRDTVKPKTEQNTPLEKGGDSFASVSIRWRLNKVCTCRNKRACSTYLVPKLQNPNRVDCYCCCVAARPGPKMCKGNRHRKVEKEWIRFPATGEIGKTHSHSPQLATNIGKNFRSGHRKLTSPHNESNVHANGSTLC